MTDYRKRAAAGFRRKTSVVSCFRSRRDRHRDDDGERGSVLVEFALALPIFAVMLFRMIHFGLVFTVGRRYATVVP
jgi:Flp pilus assembly protein TadG